MWYGFITNIYSNETYERARNEQLIKMESKQNSVLSLTLKPSVVAQPLPRKGKKKFSSLIVIWPKMTLNSINLLKQERTIGGLWQIKLVDG